MTKCLSTLIYYTLVFALTAICILTGCGNDNVVGLKGQTEIDSLIFSKDSISNFGPIANTDTVYRDTTINKLRFKFDLATNDMLADSSVWSSFFISGNPSVAYQTYGKNNNRHIEYLWKADSSVNYLHVGFDVYDMDSPRLTIKMYNIKIYRVY